MIVVTGASGFIASRLVKRLNELGEDNIILVDDFNRKDKRINIEGLNFRLLIDRNIALGFVEKNIKDISGIYHLGARTDTTEFNEAIFNKLNLDYSKAIWNLCASANIPMVYASSAATYGDGNLGFNDDHNTLALLQPLNPYGWSKQDFDIWALTQESSPSKWIGLKFFNVYGPHESHKGRMASVVFHSFNKIRTSGKMQLFKSHMIGIEDGHQSRDFIHVDDIINICLHCMNEKIENGIYNAGTGKARTFLDLTLSTFRAMKIDPNIEFIDTPMDIRDKYQYFTEANINKLIATGYTKHFITLEEGVDRYVNEFLIRK